LCGGGLHGSGLVGSLLFSGGFCSNSFSGSNLGSGSLLFSGSFGSSSFSGSSLSSGSLGFRSLGGDGSSVLVSICVGSLCSGQSFLSAYRRPSRPSGSFTRTLLARRGFLMEGFLDMRLVCFLRAWEPARALSQ
jgi:hypothetical protein